MLGRAFSSLVVVCALGLVACSSSDSGSGSPQGVNKPPDAFSNYCTGTMQTSQNLMKPMPGGWIGDGSQKANVGSTFLVAVENQQWQGFYEMPDGSIEKIESDFTKGLVKGTDFTSDCAVDAALTDYKLQKTVLLASSKVYATKDMSGAACTLDAGTPMTNFMYSSGMFSGGGPASVSSDEIKAKCGFTQGYSNDIEYGTLLPKS